MQHQMYCGRIEINAIKCLTVFHQSCSGYHLAVCEPSKGYLSISTLSCSESDKTIFDWCKEGNLEEVQRFLSTSPNHLNELDDSVRSRNVAIYRLELFLKKAGFLHKTYLIFHQTHEMLLVQASLHCPLCVPCVYFHSSLTCLLKTSAISLYHAQSDLVTLQHCTPSATRLYRSMSFLLFLPPKARSVLVLPFDRL